MFLEQTTMYNEASDQPMAKQDEIILSDELYCIEKKSIFSALTASCPLLTAVSNINCVGQVSTININYHREQNEIVISTTYQNNSISK